MDLNYLEQRYRNKVAEYWSHWRVFPDDPLVDLAAFTPDNCVLQYETCLQYNWCAKDWVSYCYPDAKMFCLYRDHGPSIAIKWKLEEWNGWGE